MPNVTFYQNCVNNETVYPGVVAENAAWAGSFLPFAVDILAESGGMFQKGAAAIAPWTFLTSGLAIAGICQSRARMFQKVTHIETAVVYTGIALLAEATAYALGWSFEKLSPDLRRLSEDFASRDMQCRIGSYMPEAPRVEVRSFKFFKEQEFSDCSPPEKK